VRRWQLGLSAVAMAALVTSCTPGRPAAEAYRLPGARLEVVGPWSGTEQARFSLVLDAFRDKTGAVIHYTSAHGHVPSTLDARFAAADPPDVAMLPQPGLLRRYAKAGRLIPLDSVTERIVERHYAPAWRNLASYSGRNYGVWFKAANKSLIWYDLSIFERTGIAPPRDIDGLLRVAGVLRARGIAAFAAAGADPWTLTDWFENLYLALAGPARYQDLAEHRTRWTDPSVARALRAMASLLSPEFVLGGTAGAVRTTFEDSVAQAFGRPPAAAMVAEGDFVASVVSARTPARIGVDVDVFPFPARSPGASAVVGGGDVAVQLKASAAASALMRFLASPDAAAIWAAAGGFISPNLDLDLSVYPDSLFRSIARRLIEVGDAFRFDLSDLQPADFGTHPGTGLQGELRQFLQTHDVPGTQRRLESEAATAFGQQGR